MKLGRIVLACIVCAPAAFAVPAKPDPKSPQYIMGYEAGRRDERADLCNRFEKHGAVATGLLGQARMVLIRAFCAARI